MKHKHLFTKIFEGNVEIDEKKSMESMFGKMPPLPKGKKWGKITQWETRYKCKCGETQTMVDVKDGAYNQSLPGSFTLK